MRLGISAVTLSAALLPLLAASGAGATTPSFSISMSPGLSPSFSPSIHDYVEKCGSSTQTLSTTGTGSVTIGGKVVAQPAHKTISLVSGQEVIVVSSAGDSYRVRCIPDDFPAYTVSITGTPTAKGYLVAPVDTFDPAVPSPTTPYVVAFNRNGVPMWWKSATSATEPAAVQSGGAPQDPKFFGQSSISWWIDGLEVFHNLDGTVTNVLGGSGTIDQHDIVPLPNGNYLTILDVQRNCPADPSQCIDLSTWGVPNTNTCMTQCPVLDTEIVELDPSNNVVWQWDPLATTHVHIDLAAENTNWRQVPFQDYMHMNSLQYDGNGGIVFSLRHLDAVYRMDMNTGDITWKLGGTTTPQSLTVLRKNGSPYTGSLFSGQHFARLYANGTLSVHDNETRGGPSQTSLQPRVLLFSIDTNNKKAQIIHALTDARITKSVCCGGAQLLASGNWFVGWGGNFQTVEYDPLNNPVFTLNTYPYFSYRSSPVTATQAALRAGMDAMVPPYVLP